MNRHSGRPCSTVRMRRSSVMQMLAIVALAVILPPSLSAAQVQSTTGEFPELKDMPFSDRLRRIDERPEPGRSSPSDSTDFPRLDDRLPTNPDEMAPDESRSLPPQPTDLPPDAPAGIDRSHIDWTVQRVSAVDLEVGREWRFEHGSATMTPAEESDYADLIRLALNRRRLITAGIPDDVGAESAWQSAFYRYEQVRRQAWAQGNLTLSGRVTLQQDPFSGQNETLVSPLDQNFTAPGQARYSLLQDMLTHPGEFTGRPVVLYGIFTPSGAVRVAASGALEGEESEFAVQRGAFRSLSRPGSIAVVDAMGFRSSVESVNSTAWPVTPRRDMPVLLKGWFVKLWGTSPLLFAESLKVLSPIPWRNEILDNVTNRRRLTSDESWLYHETLRQLQVTSLTAQRELAREQQLARMKQLRAELQVQVIADRQQLEDQFQRETASGADKNDSQQRLEDGLRRLQRQLAARDARFAGWLKQPTRFPLFVDAFQNPDYWQGRLLTLRGHVRRVMTHPGDPQLFQGRPLHELWLFTEDSQHIPTVVVCPTLPRDFPTGAEIVDSVQVTGCFFKTYVYKAQNETRVAPLLLAGHIEWLPTASQVLSLVRDGQLPADSPLAAQAREKDTDRPEDLLVLLTAALALLVAMTVWSRVQRDRRERQRVLRLVDEPATFRQT
ncbi:MAG: hypothetical protein RIT02_549 [Planctomycetota bacterium]